jgi:hypothetical protein
MHFFWFIRQKIKGYLSRKSTFIEKEIGSGKKTAGKKKKTLSPPGGVGVGMTASLRTPSSQDNLLLAWLGSYHLRH